MLPSFTVLQNCVLTYTVDNDVVHKCLMFQHQMKVQLCDNVVSDDDVISNSQQMLDGPNIPILQPIK